MSTSLNDQSFTGIEDLIEMRPASIGFPKRQALLIKLSIVSLLIMIFLVLQTSTAYGDARTPAKQNVADWNETPVPDVSAPTADANTHLRWGDAAFQARNFHRAISEYSSAISLDGTDFRSYWGRCKSYYETEWYRHAIEDCLQAYTLSNYNTEVALSLSVVCYEQAEVEYQAQHDDEAEKYYLWVLEYDPNNQSGKVGLSYRRLGEIYAEYEYYEQAIDYYRTAILFEPAENEQELIWSHLVNLGWTLFVMDDYGLAMLVFSTALEIDDSLPDPYLGLGYVYDAQYLYQQALVFYKQYIGIAADSADRGVLERVKQIEDILVPEVYCSVVNWVSRVNNNRLMDTVMVLEGFQNRHSLSTPAADTGIHAAAGYLKGRFEAIKSANPYLPLSVETQSIPISYAGMTTTNDNIFMVIPGLDTSAGVIVVGAHYDTISNSDPTNPEAYQPGANDNGSGVSAVLELAEIMAQSNHHATLIFALFAGEEFEPRFGSTHFAEYLETNHYNVQAVLTMDMVGSPTGPNGERYDNQMRVFSEPPVDSPSRKLARLIELVARVYLKGEMNVTVGETIDRPGRWGDHISFNQAGFPSIRMIEYREDTTRQHNAMDRSDDVDAAYLGRITKLVLATLLVLSDGLNPPSDCHVDTGLGRLEWTPVPGSSAYTVALRRPGASVYDQTWTITDSQFTWTGLVEYEAVGIAVMDANGQLGPFAEWPIIQ